MMRTAFGILLFVLVYAPIAYMVYAELKRQQPRVRPQLAKSAPRRHSSPLPATSQN